MKGHGAMDSLDLNIAGNALVTFELKLWDTKSTGDPHRLVTVCRRIVERAEYRRLSSNRSGGTKGFAADDTTFLGPESPGRSRPSVGNPAEISAAICEEGPVSFIDNDTIFKFDSVIDSILLGSRRAGPIPS